ncbi:hypothetical protein PsorP6_015366 [Peronosclerospora sorghi]|uniref:Uncharacterized protein n=1 Tax=Peronosclerospora sorghi TaxID=230839 RepID=A0ACC0WM11_9STRA|nr:hypothetical protein PsorP6_015366 [Peronosclerospora sorghi]
MSLKLLTSNVASIDALKSNRSASHIANARANDESDFNGSSEREYIHMHVFQAIKNDNSAHQKHVTHNEEEEVPVHVQHDKQRKRDDHCFRVHDVEIRLHFLKRNSPNVDEAIREHV